MVRVFTLAHFFSSRLPLSSINRPPHGLPQTIAPQQLGIIPTRTSLFAQPPPSPSSPLGAALIGTWRSSAILAAMKLIRFTALLLLAVVSTRASTLSGTVRDSEGAVIANAQVTVHWDRSGSNYLKDNL